MLQEIIDSLCSKMLYFCGSTLSFISQQNNDITNLYYVLFELFLHVILDLKSGTKTKISPIVRKKQSHRLTLFGTKNKIQVEQCQEVTYLQDLQVKWFRIIVKHMTIFDNFYKKPFFPPKITNETGLL